RITAPAGALASGRRTRRRTRGRHRPRAGDRHEHPLPPFHPISKGLPVMTLSTLRVAIVGAGPAGIYAGNLLAQSVDALRRAEGPASIDAVEIDLFESLPAPYGLIRYGVAPDHPRIKGIVTSLHEMLDAFPEPGAARRTIRFIGNVEVGRDIAL